MTLQEISINSYIRGYFDEDAERKYREFKVINILGRLEEVESEEGEIFYIDDCEGIPLTEEILKANFGNIGSIDIPCISVLVNGNAYCNRFNYVHQLQHALRLCDLNNLADNFKIE